MDIPLLKEIFIIFGLSVGVIFLFHKVRLPTIVAFFLTGILAGPYGLKLVGALHDVKVLAEVGVILLLFTIGLEFSLQSLLRLKKTVLFGGTLQVLITVLVVFIIDSHFASNPAEALVVGYLLSLSSTAIVLRLLQERGEVTAPYGKASLGILIFQDIIIIPMIISLPLLAGNASVAEGSALLLLVKAILIIVLVLVSARHVVPFILYHIARTRSRELFLLSIVVICLAVAWLTSSIGLSLALGAFLAGLIISESEYSHHALGTILPFRDVFTSFFFISIGMLLDIPFFFEHPALIILIALGVIIVKAIVAGLVSFVLGYSLRTVILTGFALSQIGEFSFVLANASMDYGLLRPFVEQIFLEVSVLTLAMTPFIISCAPHVVTLVSRLPLPAKIKNGLYADMHPVETGLKDHTIIVGFGINGRNVARASRLAGVPYIIIEMNPDTVKQERGKHEPICYGDATQEAVLKCLNVEQARVLVVAIAEPVASRQIIAVARQLNQSLYIIARTRFLQEMQPLYELGADEVIPEEYETSVEIFTRVLNKYLVSRQDIEKFVTELRLDGYHMFRYISGDPRSLCDLTLHVSDVDIRTLNVLRDSPLSGKTLQELAPRGKWGVTLLAIRRQGKIISNPGGDTLIQGDDEIIVMGKPNNIASFATALSGKDL